MHREPKNKNPFGTPSKDATDSDSLKSELDLPFEDRAHNYWQQNKSSLIAVIVIAALGILVTQGMKISKEKAIQKLQEAYQSAQENGTTEAFIDENSETLLAGFAALKQANSAFETADYESAFRLFLKAEQALSKASLKSRATLGAAFSMLQINPEEGIQRLESILEDESQLESSIAEAAYALASIASANGDTEKAKNLADLIQSLENAGSWSFRVSQFQ